MRSLKLLTLASILSLAASSVANAGTIGLNLTLSVDTVSHTWTAYALISGDTTRTTGLAGLDYTISATGGAKFSDNDFTNDLSTTVFSTLNLYHGANTDADGFDTTASAQGFQASVNKTTAPLTQNLAIGTALKIAEGTYVPGSVGSTLSISGLTTKTTFLPSPLPAATKSGAAVATFSPDSVIGQSVVLVAQTAVNEFILGAGSNGETSAATIDLTVAPNHQSPLYTPEIQIASDKQTKGSVTITNLTSPAYALLWLASASDLPTGAIALDSATLAKYASIYAGSANGTPNYAIALSGSTAQIAWDFSNTGAGSTNKLLGIAIVPEPASLGLLALGALGLIGKRRSK